MKKSRSDRYQGVLIGIGLAFFICFCSHRHLYGTTLTILYTGRSDGELTGCDCPQGLPGGLARRATVVRQVRAVDPNVLLVDAGDMLSTYAAPREDRTILEVLRQFGYDCLNVGDQEFIDGLDRLTPSLSQLPWVATNIFDQQHQPLTADQRTKNISGINVAMLGVIDRASFDLVPLDSIKGINVPDPEPVLQ
jgi:2',3'-cyclic-nucleotide 2'-phosphodiesterase (5'-nucleotidase family)